MKRIYTLLLMMCLAVAMSAETYNITIKGVKVTDDNKKDVLGDGKTKYDPSTKTLTFYSVNYEYDKAQVLVVSGISGIKIVLDGNNTLRSTIGHAITLVNCGNATISGDRVDNRTNLVESTGSRDGSYFAALYLNNTNITFENMYNTYTFSSKYGYAIAGNKGTETITSTTDEIRLKAADKILNNIAGFTLTKSSIGNTNGEFYSSELKTIAYDEANPKPVKNTTVILSSYKYNIFVGGVQVTDMNASDILGDGTVRLGRFSNSPRKYLYFKNANIVNKTGEGVFCKDEYLSDMLFMGNNTIIGTNALFSNASNEITLRSDCGLAECTADKMASLTLSQPTTSGSYTKQNTVINNKIVNFRNIKVGFSKGTTLLSGSLNDNTLNLYNSQLEFTLCSKGAIYGFKEINYTNCFVPKKYQYSAKLSGYTLDGSTLANDMIIWRGYNLMVDGIPVTLDNYKSAGRDGKASYALSSHTLTLNNINRGISIEAYEDINIQLASNTYMEAGDDGYVLSAYGNVRFFGAYPLKMGAYNDRSCIVMHEKGKRLHFQDADATIYSENQYAINAPGCEMVVSGKLSAKGKTGSVAGISDLILQGETAIVSPRNATLVAGTGICLNGKLVKDQEVVFGKSVTYYDLSVAGIEVTEENKDDIAGNGNYTYNPDTQTLTVKGNTMPRIKATNDITVNVTGNCELSYTKNNISTDILLFEFAGDATITGNGALTIKSGANTNSVQAIGLTTKGKTLTFKDIDIFIATPGKYSYGIFASDCKMVVDNSNISISSSVAAVAGIKSLDLKGTAFSEYYKYCTVVPGEGIYDGNLQATLIEIVRYVKDEEAPTVADKTITPSGNTQDSFTIKWTAASDNATPASDIVYTISYATQGGTPVEVATLKGVTEYQFTGLADDTEYIITIKATDQEGNTTEYATLTAKTAAIPVVDGISSLNAHTINGKTYRTSGTVVNNNYRGVIISSSKKYIKR